MASFSMVQFFDVTNEQARSEEDDLMALLVY